MATRATEPTVKFLDGNLPSLSTAEAAEAVRGLYGLDGTLEPVVTDRDQNFNLAARDGRRYMLKIASAEEDESSLDFQARALLHIERQDPDLPVPRIVKTREGRPFGSFQRRDGSRHLVHMLTYLPGETMAEGPVSPALLNHIGATLARLGRALRGFYHPAGGREMVWDIRQLPKLAPHIDVIGEPGLRNALRKAARHFADEVMPRLEGMRAQTIHADVNVHNLLVDPARPDRVAGIIDFGDMIHGALALDVGVTAGDFFIGDERGLEPACHVVAGYHGVTPLEDAEVDILYDLTLARVVAAAIIGARRLHLRPEDPGYIGRATESYIRAFGQLVRVGREAATRAFRGACAAAPAVAARLAGKGQDDEAAIDALIERRKRVMGPQLYVFYERPLHLVRGRGVWLYDAAGRAYLDCYNNVPQVGHCHPHVVAAIARQAATLNTNTRYLFREVLDYAERLVATMPAGLDTVSFVNSGSEAVDMAWRLATAWTGRKGALVMADAYHGWTTAVHALSPAIRAHEPPAPHVRTIPAPDDYRGPIRRGANDIGPRYAADIDKAIASLREGGYEPAALIVDSGLCSNGMVQAPEGYLKSLFERARAAGALVVADEVQSGFGRMGDHMWGFGAHQAVPDIVTMGKPIGNGHPVGCVVTRHEVLAHMVKDETFFSTFGGNNVSSAAAGAVLDVIEQEGLLENARTVGAHLKQGMARLMEKHGIVGDVRGRGLLVGVELVKDRRTLEPATEETKRVVNLMRELGVLVSREGPHDNVLKIRPPLVLKREEADIAVDALDRALKAL